MSNIEKMHRRDFIRLSGAGIASLAGVSVMFHGGCSGLKRGDVADSEDDVRLKKRLGEARSAILGYASLAPSPHNTQPWYVKIADNDHWIIGADQTRRMASTDPNSHRLVLAIGCFIENLSIAAGALGFEADIRLLNSECSGTDMAAVTLRKSAPKPYPLERLTLRKTVKNGYSPGAMSKDHLAALSEPLAGHFFFFPRTESHGECIRKGAVDSFREWLDSREAQEEHIRWLRVGDDEARKKRDGLTTEGMEIKGPVGWLVRSFFSPDDFTKGFMKRETMKFVGKTAGEGAGYAIITGYGRTVAGMIELGRRFERMALLAREMNVGIHPMTQILEMPSGRELVRSNHRPGIDPQLILRIGYVDNYPGPVTLRRPLGRFVRYA